MKIPKSIRISGFDYEVLVSKGLTGKDIDSDEHGEDKLCGYIDFETQKILINENITQDRTLETMLHETMHGIFIHYHVPVPEELHEDSVVLIAEGLFQVLKDNPDLLKCFIEETPKTKSV